MSKSEYDKSYQSKFYYETKEAKKRASENRKKNRISINVSPKDFNDCIKECIGEDNGTENI